MGTQGIVPQDHENIFPHLLATSHILNCNNLNVSTKSDNVTSHISYN